MSPIVEVSRDMAAGLDPAALQARLFAGEVLLFRDQPAVAALVEQADRMIRAAFPGGRPERVTERMTREAFIADAAGLRRAYGDDAGVLDLWREALAACGCRLEDTYWDRMRVRVNTPGTSHHSRRVLNLPAHRDSWGSMLRQQINWWAPVYPLNAGRTLLIYPEAWDRAVANDSASWDLEELKRRRAAGDVGDYPLLPSASDAREWGEALPILPAPGEIVAFSAAHLHASAENRTGLSRFNIEGRTLDARELAMGRGAPNPDGAAPRIAYHWFEHCRTGEPLTESADYTSVRIDRI